MARVARACRLDWAPGPGAVGCRSDCHVDCSGGKQPTAHARAFSDALIRSHGPHMSTKCWHRLGLVPVEVPAGATSLSSHKASGVRVQDSTRRPRSSERDLHLVGSISHSTLGRCNADTNQIKAISRAFSLNTSCDGCASHGRRKAADSRLWTTLHTTAPAGPQDVRNGVPTSTYSRNRQ
jgi:hypothetical protein